jgi:hypothetical protein
MGSAGTAKDATALSAMIQKRKKVIGHKGSAEAKRVIHVHGVFP